MAPSKSTQKKDSYSVILPTFNERQNLPIITWLLNRTFTEQYIPPLSPPRSNICTHTNLPSPPQQPRLGTHHRR